MNVEAEIKNINNKRILWIDTYKSVGIILVIWGHLQITSYMFNFIYIFHVYAFFLIGGLLHKYNKNLSGKSIFVQNLKKLYVPFVFFSGIWIVFSALKSNLPSYLLGSLKFSWVVGFEYFISIILTSFYGTDSFFGIHVGPAWFLSALFTVRVFYSFIQLKSDNNKVILALTSIVLFITGFLLNSKNVFPLSMAPAMTAFMFYYMGDFFRDSIYRVNALNNYKKIMLLILFTCVCYMCSFYLVDPLLLYTNSLPRNPIILIMGASSGIFSLILVSMVLSSFNKIKLNKFASFIGSNSLIIMGIHSPISVSLQYVLRNTVGGSIQQLLQNVIILLATLIISVPITIYIKKYFPFLIGYSKSKDGGRK